jgi:hypothetical protein
MSDDNTPPLPELNSSDECETGGTSPQEMANKVVDRSECRDPKTGQFVAGWKGGGRPKGSKDKLNQQVIGTLERIWQSRGDEIIEHLAAEKPEVLAGLVAKLIPQSLAAEAITGEAEKAQGNQEVTVRVVTQQHQDVLPPREVEGELVDENDSQHLTH